MDVKELIHLLTAYPLVYRKDNLPELPRELEDTLNTINPTEYIYLDYCIHAYNPKNRNYDMLREFLACNIRRRQLFLIYELEEFMKRFSEINTKKITKIYDLGAGHDEWARLLKIVFPNAKIVLIEKSDTVLSSIFNVRNITVEYWIGNLSQYCNTNNTLVFMSEFLHCKKDNIKLLKFPEINKCHILINEINPSETFIDYRLKQTGGGLIHPIVLANKVENYHCYENFFNYYFAYRKPKI